MKSKVKLLSHGAAIVNCTTTKLYKKEAEKDGEKQTEKQSTKLMSSQLNCSNEHSIIQNSQRSWLTVRCYNVQFPLWCFRCCCWPSAVSLDRISIGRLVCY